MVQLTATPVDGAQVAQWLAWADEDYLAARALLLRGFVLQGTVLANTAVEKYLKTALLAKNVHFRNSHDVSALHKQLKASAPGLPPISTTFLHVLSKAYKLRYPDDLPVGFNMALAAVKILTDTDLTVHVLRKGFQFQRGDGRSVTTMLDNLLSIGDASLLEQNIAFGECSRADVFGKPTACYEIRVLSADNIIWAKYETGPIPDDGILVAEGLKPK